MSITELLVLVDVDGGDNPEYGAPGVLKMLLHYVTKSTPNKNIKIIWYVFNSERCNVLAQLVGQVSLRCQIIVEVLGGDCDLTLGYDCREGIDAAIRYGKHFEYAKAIEMQVPSVLSKLPLWYFGMVANGDFAKNEFIQKAAREISGVMPVVHQQKTISWIAAMRRFNSVDRLPWLTSLEVDVHEIIGLIRLMHGFEYASGDACDEFDLKCTLDSLGVDLVEISAGKKLYEYNFMEDKGVYSSFEKYADEMTSFHALKYTRLKVIFATPESLFYTLWYSGRATFTMSCTEKDEVLFSCHSGMDIELMDRVNAYDFVRGIYTR